jgi:hypothetical protein
MVLSRDLRSVIDGKYRKVHLTIISKDNQGNKPVSYAYFRGGFKNVVLLTAGSAAR